MVAIKKKNNRNSYYPDPHQPISPSRIADIRSYTLAKLEEQIRRIYLATEAARTKISTAEDLEHVLADLQSVADDCGKCRLLVDKAIGEQRSD